MKKDDFLEMINGTTFDSDMKRLFVTSYEMGHYQGRIDQMQSVLDKMKVTEIEKEMNSQITH